MPPDEPPTTPATRPEFEHTLRCGRHKGIPCTCGASERREWYERGFREGRDAIIAIIADTSGDDTVAEFASNRWNAVALSSLVKRLRAIEVKP